MIDHRTQIPVTFEDYMLSKATGMLGSGPPIRLAAALGIGRAMARMRRCKKRRAKAEAEHGLQVPVVLFLAITGRCNLSCPHCYTSGYEREHMPVDLAERILCQADDLGISLIVVTGGEPLLHREFFSIPRCMPDVPFLVFTNGTLVPEFLAERGESPNMLWAVSVDGPRELCDARRGAGSFDSALRAMAALRSREVPFGFSSVVSTDNLSATVSPAFVQQMTGQGCCGGFFLEQIPGPACDPPLGQQVADRLIALRQETSVPVAAFPSDEITYGGCQAGGNGIVHVSPQGMVEPCPAAHVATHSLQDFPLVEALRSPFLARFRELKQEFSTGQESCTYADNVAAFRGPLADCGACSTTCSLHEREARCPVPG